MFATFLALIFMIGLFVFCGLAWITLFETRRELKRFKFLCDNLSIHLDVDE